MQHRIEIKYVDENNNVICKKIMPVMEDEEEIGVMAFRLQRQYRSIMDKRAKPEERYELTF